MKTVTSNAHVFDASNLFLALGFFLCFFFCNNVYAEENSNIEALHQLVFDLEQRIDQRLNLNGYFDFEYLADDKQGGTPSSFRQHHISLFVSQTIDQWRIFSELEFEDGVAITGAGTTVSGSGTIKMEHGWVEYMLHQGLSVRGGKMLLPQYWNVNHYPNTVLSTNRPLMVRNVFPADTTGISLQWSRHVSGFWSTLDLYVGNGESINSSKVDDNENKAVGGRLNLHLDGDFSAIQRFDIGLSYHNEKPASSSQDIAISGFEAQINSGDFELLMEWARRERNSDNKMGYYLQPSIKFAPALRGFYRFDYFNDNSSKNIRNTLGLNYRPVPPVSLKLEFNQNHMSPTVTDSYYGIATSVAVFF